MPKSMTGFARTDLATDWGQISCELRSVNSRFLDLGFRMPDGLRAQEHALREQIRQQLVRGKVECSFNIKLSASTNQTRLIDREAVQSYLNEVEELSDLIGHGQSLSAADLLRLPGVLATQQVDTDSLAAAAASALNAALKQMNEFRQREGDALVEELKIRTRRMRELALEVREIAPRILENLTQKLRVRVQEVTAEADASRLEQELVILSQRLDVAEEIDRLQAHLDQIESLLTSKKPVGRELDFLMQELNREANTLGSKSQGLSQTNIAVEMKVLIEQMREQIQNIE